MIDNVDDALAEQEAQRAEQEAVARGHALRAIIDFGLAVEQFLNGEVGGKLVRDATNERRKLTEEYILLNPDIPIEREHMSDIRNRVLALNVWQEFFWQYVKDGEAAQEQFKAMELVE